MTKLDRGSRYLILILLLAFVIRLALIVALPTEPISDFADFDGLAVRVASGQGYVTADAIPTTYRPPGYPLFLAGIYTIFWHSWFMARLINALLAILTCFLTYWIGARLFSRRAGLFAALTVALFPSHILYGNLLATENLFTPLLLGIVALLVLALQRSNKQVFHLGTAGILSGLAALTRPAVILLPAVWAITLVWKRAGLRRTLFSTALISAAMAATIAPWTIRNAAATGEFVPIASEGGITFLAGHNEQAIKGHYSLEGPVFDELFGVKRSEVELDAYAYKLAFRFIRSHPGTEVRLVARKFFHFFKDDVSGVTWTAASSPLSLPQWLIYALKGVAQTYYLIILALAVASFFLKRTRDDRRIFLYILFAYWTLIHLAYYGKDRFRLPLMPILALLAAVTLSWLCDRYTQRRSLQEKEAGAYKNFRI